MIGGPSLSGRQHVGSHLVVVIPDIHVPFHDRRALEVVYAAVRYLKPHKIVLLGDVMDCAAFSAHAKKQLAELHASRYLDDEVTPTREILDELGKWCNELVYVEGNHEFRVERFAVQWGGSLGPDIYRQLSPRALLSEGRSNFEWIPYAGTLSHHEVAGGLWAIHGWSHSRHAAAKHLDKAGSVSVVFGHVHRMQMFSKRDLKSGQIVKAWSPGCLSQLQPLYMHQDPTEWVHGFSLVFVGRDPNDWTDYVVDISNGRCILPDGKEIKI